MAVKQSNRLRALRTLLEGKPVKNLRQFQDVTLWERLSRSEREALSLLFIQAGKKVLLKKSPAVYSYFSLAENVAFYSKAMWLAQSKVWLQYARKYQNERAYSKAKDKLERAIEIEAADFCDLLELGRIYCSLAYSSRNPSYIESAELWLHRAKSLTGGKSVHEKSMSSYLGALWEISFLISEEPADLLKAINCYQEIYSSSCSSPGFLKTYATCLLRMEKASSKPHYALQAMDVLEANIHKKNLKEHEDLLKCYARCAKRVYEITGKEALFQKSQEAYLELMGYSNEAMDLGTELAAMLLQSGQHLSDPKRVYHAYEFLQQIREKDPDSYLAWQYSANALAYMGYYTDQFNLLKEAEQVAKIALKLAPEEAYSWCVYGDVLEKLGIYFEDDEYISKAVESFKKGIKLDPRSAQLWEGIGGSIQYRAELKADLELFDYAIHYHLKALENAPNNPHIMNKIGWLSLRKSELSNQKEDVENAVKFLEMAINARKDVGGEPESSWLYNYGCSLDFLGDYLESTECYEKAIGVLAYLTRIEPDDLAARYNLALAWSHLGEVTSEPKYFLIAIGYFKEIVTVDPEDELSWNDWGVALLNLASIETVLPTGVELETIFSEAEEKLEKAIELGCANAYYHLACHRTLQHYYEAAVELLYLAESNGGLPPLSEMLKDDWLEDLREQPIFKQFLNDIGYQE